MFLVVAAFGMEIILFTNFISNITVPVWTLLIEIMDAQACVNSFINLFNKFLLRTNHESTRNGVKSRKKGFLRKTQHMNALEIPLISDFVFKEQRESVAEISKIHFL